MMEGEGALQNRSDAPALIAPFATWMVLMFVLPSEPWAYAVRTAATLAALAWSWKREVKRKGEGEQRKEDNSVVHLFSSPSPMRWLLPTANYQLPTSLAWGLAVGLVVLFLWVWPEKAFAWYRTYCMYGYTANASVDSSGWALKAIRLFGSAFIISVAEELFFRKWLLRYAGFLWMVGLFAVQHNRWLAAAITGVLYGWLAMRKGLLSAIVAHVVTNLALGIYVLWTGDWGFW